MRIEQTLRENAQKYAAKTALVAGEKRLTYAEIDDCSDRLAARLLSGGVEKEDRVVIFMDNCWEAFVAIYAVFKAGAVVTLVNPSTKADKLAYILNDSGASALLTQSRLLRIANAALEDAPHVQLKLNAGNKGPSSETGFVSLNEAMFENELTTLPAPGLEIDLAMLIYTSGSTGFPKGVMMTHQNVIAAAGSITTYLENTSEDIILCALPISFDYGLYQILMSVKVGATLVLEKSFAFPYAVLEKMVEENVTGFPMVPTMAALILQMKDLETAKLPNLRYISSTAAALAPATIEQIRDLFPDTSIYSMYGLTECKRCTWLPPEELDRRPDSVGIAIPGTEAYVVGDDGEKVATGDIGELVIRGPHVMKGYWQNPEATNRTLRPGKYAWEKVLHTGDLFYQDKEGFLYFVGRKDDIIKSRGEKVSPKEVENTLYAMPGISEAVVIGVPDEVLGSAIKAVIVTAPDADLSEKDIQRYCTRNLEDYMVPKYIELTNQLPKTNTGKLSRRLVAESMEA